MRVIVHGGAGSAPDDPEGRQAALDEAAAAGAEAGSVVEAVEAAIRPLESDLRFNAGRGGAIQSDGVVRVDAGLMTDDREAGAIAAAPAVEHAIDAARVVHEETPHVLVTGARAVDLAAAFGVRTDVDLTTAATRERFAAAGPPEGGPREQLRWVRGWFGDGGAGGDGASDVNGAGDGPDGDRRSERDRRRNRDRARDHDTVGAVAGDGERFAAATSTAGRWFALAGRAGDVPQVGAGFYCSPAGGASATGAGEDIARATLTREAVRELEAGADAETAAGRALDAFAAATGSEAGLIVADGAGVGSAYNAAAMQTAVAERE